MPRRDWYCEDVLSGKLPVQKLWEDERVLAFHHPEAHEGIHVVVIPKQHILNILSPEALEGALLLSLLKAVQAVAALLGLDKDGFYLRTNVAAPGVTPHMHWHIYGPGVP